jgi:hypothetical protein
MTGPLRCQRSEGERSDRVSIVAAAGLLALGTCTPLATSRAQSLDISGYGEAILADTPSTASWTDGGFGKLRWGGSGSARQVDPELSALLLEAAADLPGGLHVLGDLRYDPKQKSALDLLDASIAWRPPASGPWSGSVKLGAFFPPFGLENTDIGWSSPWTLTYSALDSWIAEEVRTIGTEARVAWRGEQDALSLTGSVFGWDDGAGSLLAIRGWDLGSRSLGLFDHQRLPDLYAGFEGAGTPYYTSEFDEIDDKPGWYAGGAWDDPTIGHIQLYRYDNSGSPTAERDNVYGWRTRFWEAGLTRGAGPFYVIVEGVVGNTIVNPDTDGAFKTSFHAVYALGGWTDGDWRAVIRLEQFGTHGGFSERGRGVTAALNWSPEDWLRLIGELVTVDSVRSERVLAGLPAHALEIEPQLGVRLSF